MSKKEGKRKAGAKAVQDAKRHGRRKAKNKHRDKDQLKLALGGQEYKALKKKCCDPKHPHCGGCPLLKALAKLPA